MINKETPSKNAKVPFSDIALSLSGGGYRAAAFHLGTLSFLNYIKFPTKGKEAKPLLDNVRILSTISGGTITGLMWAYSKIKQESFATFFNDLYELMDEKELMDLAFDKLTKTDDWQNPHKSKNLINAFAEVYNEYFFDNADFNSFLDVKKEIELPTLVFGATEFINGRPFRFQNNGRFGNHDITTIKTAVEEIKLGDIVAASSCFPFGFEPILFPTDFIQNNKGALATDWKSNNKPIVALMDGGITDNQGFDGIKKAVKRLEKTNTSIDTYIISDVAGQSMSPLQANKFKQSKSWLTLRRLNILLIILSIISFSGLLTSFFCLFMGYSFWWTIGLILFPLLLLIGLTGLFLINKSLRWINQTMEKMLGQGRPTALTKVQSLKKAPIKDLYNFIKARGTSGFKMVNDIFLGRIRRMSYNDLYEEENWKFKLIGNFIYSMKDSNLDLSDECLDIINLANEMDTTLWFSSKNRKEEMLNALIITGQLTTCYKLMAFIDKKKSSPKYEELFAPHLDAINLLHAELIDCLAKFKKNEKWLLNGILNNLNG